MRDIGVLMTSEEHNPQAQSQLAGFKQGLQELGWIEGRNIQVDYRFGAADLERIQRFEGLEKKQFTRVVGSGTNQRISFFTSLNPDCTARGNINIRVTKQPEHGSTEIIPEINFPTYPKEHVRAKCNDHKVRGMQVYYKSAEKYVGSDELELLVLFPNGFAWEVHYGISVR